VGLLQAPCAGFALTTAGSLVWDNNFATSKNRERDRALALGGCCFIFRCNNQPIVGNNQPIVGLSGCFNERAEARPGQRAGQGANRHHFGRQIERQKMRKIKYAMAIEGCCSIFFTQQPTKNLLAQ
jgi:hypothetical protein